MTKNHVKFDHDKISYTVTSLRDLAAEMDQKVASQLEQMLDSFKATASQSTATGAPAPIYSSVLEAADRAGAALLEKVSAITKTLRADADILEKSSTQAAGIAADSAAELGKAGN